MQLLEREGVITKTIIKYINRISRITGYYRSNSLDTDELNGRQITYILLICKNPGISQDTIAKKLVINKSNVTRQLSQLENHGFITRMINPEDKRSISIYPTQEAERLFPQIKASTKQWNEYLLEGLNEQETATLYSLLEKVLDNAQKHYSLQEEER